MGHKITADRETMDLMRTRYAARAGLEGPFNFSGRVLYYDPREGAYWDPTCDWYVRDEEMTIIHMQLLAVIAG